MKRQPLDQEKAHITKPQITAGQRQVWDTWQQCHVEYNGITTMETSSEFPKKSQIESQYDAAIAPLSPYPKEWKWGSGKDNGTPLFFGSLLVLAEI